MSDINAIESTGRSAGLTFQKVGGDDMVLGKFPGHSSFVSISEKQI